MLQNKLIPKLNMKETINEMLFNMDANSAFPRHMHQLLPLLPSGSGGVGNLSLRRDQVSTIHNTKDTYQLQV